MIVVSQIFSAWVVFGLNLTLFQVIQRYYVLSSILVNRFFLSINNREKKKEKGSACQFKPSYVVSA